MNGRPRARQGACCTALSGGCFNAGNRRLERDRSSRSACGKPAERALTGNLWSIDAGGEILAERSLAAIRSAPGMPVGLSPKAKVTSVSRWSSRTLAHRGPHRRPANVPTSHEWRMDEQPSSTHSETHTSSSVCRVDECFSPLAPTLALCMPDPLRRGTRVFNRPRIRGQIPRGRDSQSNRGHTISDDGHEV
jgi:hypothetical protein